MKGDTLSNESKNNFFSREGNVFWIFFALYFLLGLAFVFLSKIWWGDEDFYFGGSWLVANGELLYRDFFIHHNPVFFYVYALPQYFFGPDIIVGRLLSFFIMMLTFVLVWRLARRLGDKTAALISSGVLITNLLIIYYYTAFAYRVLEAFLMLLFFTILFGNLRGSIKYPLSTFVLCLVVGVRYPIDIMSGLLVLYLIYIAYRNWKDKRIILLSLSVAVLALGAILLPFIAYAKEQFLFNTITYPFSFQDFQIEFGIIAEADIWHRLYRVLIVLFEVFRDFYAVAAIIFGLLVYVGWRTWQRKLDIKESISRNQGLIFLLIFIILFEVFVAAARGASVGLRSLTFPAAAIVAGVGLAKVVAGIKDGNATLLLYGLIIGLIVLTPLAQFAQGGLSRPALTWQNAEINYVSEVAKKVATYTDKGDRVLTFTPMFAHQAERELLPGTAMELWSFFPSWETERSKKYNLLNISMLLDYLSTKQASAVVLTEERFFSGKHMGKLLDKYRPEVLQVLNENYYLTEKLSYPSDFGRGSVYIYLPRQP